MKRVFLAGLLTLWFGWGVNSRLAAQEPLSYQELLAGTKEIDLADSLNFSTNTELVTALDSLTVKKWFSPVLPAAAKFRNKDYSLIGKITTGEKFDLLVLLEEKKKNDSIGIQVTYLVSVKKNGEYIASLKAAVSGTKKKTGYNISSCLYRDYKIIQDSRITTNNQTYNDMTWYRINAGGRFILSPDN